MGDAEREEQDWAARAVLGWAAQDWEATEPEARGLAARARVEPGLEAAVREVQDWEGWVRVARALVAQGWVEQGLEAGDWGGRGWEGPDRLVQEVVDSMAQGSAATAQEEWGWAVREWEARGLMARDSAGDDWAARAKVALGLEPADWAAQESEVQG